MSDNRHDDQQESVSAIAIARRPPSVSQRGARCAEDPFHLVEGRARHPGIEEMYYVFSGEDDAQVNREAVEIHKGDRVPVLLNEIHAFKNAGSRNSELMIIGIATRKSVPETILVHSPV